MVPHATPNNQPQPGTAATDKPSGSGPGWTWRETLLATAIVAFAGYSGFIVAALYYTGWRRVIPPQGNHIIMTVLGVGVLAMLALVMYHRFCHRRDEHFVVLSGQIAAQARHAGCHRCRRNGVDDPTDPIPARVIVRQPLVYAPAAEQRMPVGPTAPYPARYGDGPLDIDEATRIYLAGLYDAERHRDDDAH